MKCDKCDHQLRFAVMSMVCVACSLSADEPRVPSFPKHSILLEQFVFLDLLHAAQEATSQNPSFSHFHHAAAYLKKLVPESLFPDGRKVRASGVTDGVAQHLTRTQFRPLHTKTLGSILELREVGEDRKKKRDDVKKPSRDALKKRAPRIENIRWRAALGSGSFATTFLAKEVSTGKKVAVKVLNEINMPGQWLSKANYADPRYKTVIDQSIEECTTMRDIIARREFDDVGGALHVAACLKDGIKESLEGADPTAPLYIVMNYAGGNNLDKWWTREMQGVQTKQLTAADATADFRRLARDLMLGLHFLTNPRTPAQFIHHDLKAANLVVRGPAAESNRQVASNAVSLTIVDFGGAIKANTHQLKACTPAFRPPEELHGRYVGYQDPAHSFDIFSAALTLISLAGGNQSRVYAPKFYTRIMADSTVHLFGTPRAWVAVAACINGMQKSSSLQREQRMSEIQEHAEFVGFCVGKATEIKVQSALQKMVREISRKSKAERASAFGLLLGCPVDPGGFHSGALHVMGQVIKEWTDTGFDLVLLNMLSTDPNKRPSPQMMLDQKVGNPWLHEDFDPAPVVAEVPSYACPPDRSMDKFQHVLILPLIALVYTCPLAGCACCCGCCCIRRARMEPHVPRRKLGEAKPWIGAALAVYVQGGSLAASSYSDFGDFFKLLGVLLGFLCLLAGCSCLPIGRIRRAGVWRCTLRASAAFCATYFLDAMISTEPLREQLSFLQDHAEDVVEQMVGYAGARGEEQADTAETVFKMLSLLALVDALLFQTLCLGPCGVIVALLGMWQDRVPEHPAEARQDREGLELARAGADSPLALAASGG